ncbi:MAG: response regulator [Thermodesulfobacteriota bacterium]
MKGWKVLLIDDEEDFVMTLAERLQLRGLCTMAATDGESGLKLLPNESFDAVILDVMMPRLGGLEVLERIKAFNPQIPVIILTGRGRSEDGPRGMQLGAFDYLIKPFDIDELTQKINDAITRKVTEVSP